MGITSCWTAWSMFHLPTALPVAPQAVSESEFLCVRPNLQDPPSTWDFQFVFAASKWNHQVRCPGPGYQTNTCSSPAPDRLGDRGAVPRVAPLPPAVLGASGTSRALGLQEPQTCADSPHVLLDVQQMTCMLSADFGLFQLILSYRTLN